jgi:hypothetical protein
MSDLGWLIVAVTVTACWLVVAAGGYFFERYRPR